MRKRTHDLKYISTFDPEVIERYTTGGCVFLAKALEDLGYPTVCFEVGSKHFSNLAGDRNQYVIDAHGVWHRTNWHSWWRGYLGRKRLKPVVRSTAWLPGQPVHKPRIPIGEVKALASRLHAICQCKGIPVGKRNDSWSNAQDSLGSLEKIAV